MEIRGRIKCAISFVSSFFVDSALPVWPHGFPKFESPAHHCYSEGSVVMGIATYFEKNPPAFFYGGPEDTQKRP